LYAGNFGELQMAIDLFKGTLLLGDGFSTVYLGVEYRLIVRCRWVVVEYL